MSVCTSPIVAAINAVTTPIAATISMTMGACVNNTALRQTM